MAENNNNNQDDQEYILPALLEKASSEQIEMLKELRAMASRIEEGEAIFEKATNQSNTDLFRYLIARKWDVSAAFQQLTETLTWREKNKVDICLDSPDPNDELFETMTPHLYKGFDLEGRPLYIERTGTINVTKVLEVLTESQLMERHVRHMELQRVRMKEGEERVNKMVTQQTIIFDLRGLSLSLDSRGLGLFKETIRIDQTYYPERLGNIFIVNTPWVFKPIWAVLKPWLDPGTVKKFHVLSESESKEYLKAYIDSSQLPAEYGGTADWVVPPPTK